MRDRWDGSRWLSRPPHRVPFFVFFFFFVSGVRVEAACERDEVDTIYGKDGVEATCERDSGYPTVRGVQATQSWGEEFE